MKNLKNKLAATIVVLSVGFLALIGISIQRGNGSFVENGVGVAFNSVQTVIYRTISNTKDWFGFITHFSQIKAENDSLKEQNTKMESEISKYNQLQAENTNLKNMLNFKSQRSEYNYIGADISGISGEDYLNGFDINQGSSNGIKVGMVVISVSSDGSAGYMIGEITSVDSNYSKVMTISNPNLKISAVNQNSGKIEGIVHGSTDYGSNGQVILDYLPENSTIKVGDSIATSGVGNMFPSNISIGKVTSIKDDKAKASMQAVLSPYVDFTTLREVMVVVPKDSSTIKY
jgi:rod shape-determining protein MreC